MVGSYVGRRAHVNTDRMCIAISSFITTQTSTNIHKHSNLVLMVYESDNGRGDKQILLLKYSYVLANFQCYYFVSILTTKKKKKTHI
jgi:hypothetical protein